MKKVLLILTSVVLSVGSVLADSHEAEKMSFTPVETYTCDYNEGKGPADLDKVVKSWNDMMDKEGQGDYFAALITPVYYGEHMFDVGWLGAWRNGNAMGIGTDWWLSNGEKVAAGFAEVLTCTSHTNFAGQNIRKAPPSDDKSDMDFVLSFRNCSMKDDKEYSEFTAAHKEWSAYADEHGIAESNWVWWPVSGESNNKYDFKLLTGSDDHTSAGANWQLYSEGHFMKSNELLEDLVDCDISRVYSGKTIRVMAEEE
jgi:hypothetical protein